jgi:hypothetical protein
VDVLDRLAALRLLDHGLAQHAKQVQGTGKREREKAGGRAGLTSLCAVCVFVWGCKLLLEGEASLHDIFDNYETQVPHPSHYLTGTEWCVANRGGRAGG